MLFCGIDLHSNNSFVVVSDDTDKALYSKRLPNNLTDICAALSPYRQELFGVVVESTYNWYLLVDSKRPPPTGRHVNIIADRAVREDGTSRVVGYVNKEVRSAATRLDHFLSKQRVGKDEKITIVSDGAGEFEK